MKKALLSLVVMGCFLLPQTVYAQWDWWGMGKNQQKKEDKKEIKQEKKEVKALDKQMKAENRLAASPMNSEAAKQLREKTEAFQKRQMQMSKELQESLKGMNEEQRAKALADYREKQYKDSVTFSDEMHQENVKSLKARLDENPNMTEEKKAQIIADTEAQYKKMAEMRDKHHVENAAFFGKIDKDAKMTPEQKQAAIQEHFKSQMGAYKDMRSEVKTERKEIKDAFKDAKKAGKEAMKKPVKAADKTVAVPSPEPKKAETPKA